MGRKSKITDNEIVAEWLIQNRWKDSLQFNTKQRMPAFVEDAVYSSVYIVASVNNGRMNISPKLVFKALMLREITSESVKLCEVGYEMSDRTARRLAQCARFALDSIRHKIQEYENTWTEEEKMNWRMEKQFVQDYYDGKPSALHSPPLPKIPDSVIELYRNKDYRKYLEEVQKIFLRSESIRDN